MHRVMLRQASYLLGLFAVLSAAQDGSPVIAQPIQTLSVTVSGTVAPIHRSIAAQLATRFPTLQVEFFAAGSAEGFRRLAAGSADIIGTSRAISEREIDAFEADSFVELPIALDGVVLIVPTSNEWLDDLTLAELKLIWSGEALDWTDLRPDWPNRPISRQAYGATSGTVASLLTILDLQELAKDTELHFETETLLAAVALSNDAIGQVGLGAAASTDLPLRTVPIDFGDGPIAPDRQSLSSAEYPLGRQLWLYVARRALDRTEVARYLEEFLSATPTVAEQAGFAPLPDHIQTRVHDRLKAKVTGSVLEGGLEQAAETYGPSEDH